jgi:16S rRNA (cytosine1402-N4)-methyltransferase
VSAAAIPDKAVPGHVPVLLAEVMEALALRPGDRLIDGTFGAGGYTAAALALGAHVLAFDRDPRAVAGGEALVRQAEGRLELVCAPFSAMASRVPAGSVQAVALDLGVSSAQLDDPSYGMSFRADGPLDMRMGTEGMTAAEFLNGAPEADIADVLFRLGEEPAARRIARAVVAARPLASTGAFAELVRRTLGGRRGQRTDPATRSFQAIRMHVNDELGELDRGLAAAETVLAPGGRLAVVSFHSLEDRLVKRFFLSRAGKVAQASRHRPETTRLGPAPSFLPPSRPRRASAEELLRNPRARSAVLRAGRRTAAPPWGKGAGMQQPEERP